MKAKFQFTTKERCTNGFKLRFPDRETADLAASFRRARDAYMGQHHPPLRTYHCLYCGGYHLTSQPAVSTEPGPGTKEA
jgi:hypothetical protein